MVDIGFDDLDDHEEPFHLFTDFREKDKKSVNEMYDVTNLQASLFPILPAGGAYISTFLQNTPPGLYGTATDAKTLRNLRSFKEPKELFSLPKEFDGPLQLPRWPTECQVLEERVHHISYVPPIPEVYYKPTGREVQPKPVGEEAGDVIFQYYPISAVNYFSRSNVGGSKYLLQARLLENENDLRFESRFESGNLAKVVKITDTYYELYLRTDLYTSRHVQWFYFKVFNTRRNIRYRFSLVNLSKGDSLYSIGMKPLLYSRKDAEINAIGWRRCGDNIAYYKNEPTNGDDELTASFTLSFNIEFPHDDDDVYLAHCYPYTYSDLQDYLQRLQQHPLKSEFTNLRLLCRTLAGNNVYYLTITAPSQENEIKKKKAVVVTARVHPGETPSSWMMKGFIDFLTGDSEQAQELREKFIFKLVPMLNPDGVIVGNTRCSLTGRDLNRQYRTVIRETYPPVWHTKLMIRRLMEECGVVMYCDLHAHSRKHNVFIYGCENKRYVEKRLQEQVFPLMLHKNAADKFSFENCKFRIQRSKEGTGRVVVWMMGVAYSYTMEASFAGSQMGSRADTHFHVQDFESIGRAFCETLLDFCDQGPDKERLRAKIIERLVKEGSNADEPTNICLSDYSSDEGDTSSSSDDECKKWDTISNFQPPISHPIISPEMSKKQLIKERRRAKRQPITIQDKSPNRKPLPVHRTLLVCPLQQEMIPLSTESEEENFSNNLKQTKARKHRKAPKKHMPPELIVTAARKGRLTPSPEPVCRKHQRKSKSVPARRSSEPKENLQVFLRHKIWTGCSCNAVHSDTALSQSLSKQKAYWTHQHDKGTSPQAAVSGSEQAGKRQKKYKGGTKTDGEQPNEDLWLEKAVKTRKAKNRKKQSNKDDPKTQISTILDSRRSSKSSGEHNQTTRHSKFRKGAIATLATTRCPSETESECEKLSASKFKKKKKKKGKGGKKVES